MLVVVGRNSETEQYRGLHGGRGGVEPLASFAPRLFWGFSLYPDVSVLALFRGDFRDFVGRAIIIRTREPRSALRTHNEELRREVPYVSNLITA